MFREQFLVAFMAFFMTLFMFFHSISFRASKKLFDASSHHEVTFQELAFDTMLKEEFRPPSPTPTPAFTETDLLSSVLKRLGELEDKVSSLQSKPSEMPYEKEELLNAAVCRVDAVEAELIATKKIHFVESYSTQSSLVGRTQVCGYYLCFMLMLLASSCQCGKSVEY